MQADFHAIRTITDSFMLDNNISTSVSEAAEKIPQMKKIIANAPLCFTLHSHSIQRADQHIGNSRNSCLPTGIHLV